MKKIQLWISRDVGANYCHFWNTKPVFHKDDKSFYSSTISLPDIVHAPCEMLDSEIAEGECVELVGKRRGLDD